MSPRGCIYLSSLRQCSIRPARISRMHEYFKVLGFHIDIYYKNSYLCAWLRAAKHNVFVHSARTFGGGHWAPPGYCYTFMVCLFLLHQHRCRRPQRTIPAVYACVMCALVSCLVVCISCVLTLSQPRGLPFADKLSRLVHLEN